jgi:uncharacterized protein (UPF0276 family)
MIYLAVSDSSLSRRLLFENKITVDYFETQGPMLDATLPQFSTQKFLLHNALWNWSLGHPKALEQHDAIEITRQRLEQTKAPWLSVHLGFSAAEVRFDNTMQACSPTLPREVLLETIITNTRRLAESIAIPLLLENLDYNRGGAYESICEPTFIFDVLEQTDTALLLDLAHARVSASRFGIDMKDYLSALPMRRIKQLHVSGPRFEGQTLRDAHEPLQVQDYELLEWVLATAKPDVVTLEYSKDETMLLEQIQELENVLPKT